MKSGNTFENICNVVSNMFLGWLSYWYFIYALILIFDRKDPDDKSYVPLGCVVFVVGILAFIVPKIVYFITKKNKLEYLLCNIFPFVIAVSIMIIWAVNYQY